MSYNRLLLMVFVTFLAVVVLIPIIKRIAIHIGALDIPNKRKVHKTPIPRMGGIGIYGGFLLGYMLFGTESIRMNAILIGSFIVIITGLIDDIKPVPAKYKILGQIAAASVIPLYGGIVLQDISAFGFCLNFGVDLYLIMTLFTFIILLSFMTPGGGSTPALVYSNKEWLHAEDILRYGSMITVINIAVVLVLGFSLGQIIFS